MSGNREIRRLNPFPRKLHRSSVKMNIVLNVIKLKLCDDQMYHFKTYSNQILKYSNYK